MPLIASKQIGLKEVKKTKFEVGTSLSCQKIVLIINLIVIVLQSVVLAEKGFEAQVAVDYVMQTTQVSLPR